MSIKILTEGDRKRGFGHVARCYALYQAFDELGADVRLYVQGDAEVRNICGNVCNMIDWLDFTPSVDGDDIVIIDSYTAEKYIYDDLAGKSGLGVYFDDLDRIQYPEGLIINPSVDGADGFHGLEHAVLRKPFWDVKPRETKEKIGKVLIALGSGAPTAYSDQLAKAVRAKHPDVELAIFAQGVEGSVYGLTEDETKDLLISCDAAFTAGGQTMLELAACGTPSILIRTADNQANNINKLNAEGVGIYAGRIKNLPAAELAEKLAELADPELRRKLSRNGMRCIDGQGARRIAKRLLEQI